MCPRVVEQVQRRRGREVRAVELAVMTAAILSVLTAHQALLRLRA